jgi:hypothetical protein
MHDLGAAAIIAHKIWIVSEDSSVSVTPLVPIS